MLSISNDELNDLQPLKNEVKCKVCGAIHNVKYGNKVNEDGTKEKSNFLAFIKCPTNNECYLVGINGKEIK